MISVSQMDSLEFAGDWHDKPLKWIVNGPSQEVQKFSTKKDAMRYASIRRKSASFAEACSRY